LEFRHKIENGLNKAQFAAFMGTQAQKDFHTMCESSMKEKLSTRPDILESLLPDFPPGCRRLTPGPGYLEACMKSNVDYIGTGIKQVHADEIETLDGKIRKADIIICATGFDV
jgi:cation diffusion facilitator CzcD-associated flavoprotein CzcO